MNDIMQKEVDIEGRGPTAKTTHWVIHLSAIYCSFGLQVLVWPKLLILTSKKFALRLSVCIFGYRSLLSYDHLVSTHVMITYKGLPCFVPHFRSHALNANKKKAKKKLVSSPLSTRNGPVNQVKFLGPVHTLVAVSPSNGSKHFTPHPLYTHSSPSLVHEGNLSFSSDFLHISVQTHSYYQFPMEEKKSIQLISGMPKLASDTHYSQPARLTGLSQQ